ncbi:peptidoglycan editing factor PgeF [Humitalea sp. 24SJ18S-53]|uniref:peptidoglycan editing factor PgeF n=1 Tax=Humitalea sp. 24SJ18S-53 TaxID=3422307 RepID=UPI003D668D81
MTPPFLTASLPVPHGFFTRQGGVSAGRFGSLNASLNGRDDPALAAENRARVARAMGFAPDRLLGLVQVHGPAVATATAPWAERPTADAMVTATPGLLLGIVTADCAPVLFADPEAGVIGGAHAGWRGAVAGVLEATVDAMQALGADPARIQAAIGPCIGQASYEVAADLRDEVLAEDLSAARFFQTGRPDRWWFDLPAYCAARLARRGIAATPPPADTLADEARFFSYRRGSIAGDLPVGHQISCIGLAS